MDVFIDDKGGALCVAGDSLADLAVCGVRIWLETGSDKLPDGPKLAKEFKKLLACNVVAQVLDKQCAGDLSAGRRMVVQKKEADAPVDLGWQLDITTHSLAKV